MTYTPPWRMSTAPYYRGYTIMLRPGADRWELWHYVSDRLVHIAKTWAEAKQWADQNPAIPASGEAQRDWNHLALH